MVQVDDRVFIAPLHGQKDNIAIITGPAGAGAVLNEGNYNTWTLEWINEPSNGLNNAEEVDILIDERNGKLSIGWRDNSYKYRFGIYNISDFSAVFESPLGVNYVPYMISAENKLAIQHGLVYLTYGGASQSIQTYLMITRFDEHTIEVWRGGATPLWSRSVRLDFGNDICECYVGGISLTGKYIVASVYEGGSPYKNYLMLYKGSYVEP